MITIFTTGGTFDKIYHDQLSEFTIGDPQAVPILQDGNVTSEYQIESIIKKDSLDLNDDDRALIVSKIQSANADKILITHGTDTMANTAAYIAQHNIPNKTIILLGAMQPAILKVSDAPFNLGFALAAVQFADAGVYIAMHGKLFDHDKVVKNRDLMRFEAV